MDIFTSWLAEFRSLVDAEIEAAGGKPADGYRAVSTKTGIGYDYIYQIYSEQPKKSPKRPTADVMNAMRRVYKSGSVDIDQNKNWPFQEVSEQDYRTITPEQQGVIQGRIATMIEQFLEKSNSSLHPDIPDNNVRVLSQNVLTKPLSKIDMEGLFILGTKPPHASSKKPGVSKPKSS